MAITRAQKEAAVAALSEDIKSAKGIVFTQYRGLTVKQLDKIRKALRVESVKYQVVKVTLLKKALSLAGINPDNFKYNGPVALVLSREGETAPARLILGMQKDNPQLIFDSGIFNNELVDASMVMRLASLPSRAQLLSQLLSVLAGPQRGLVTVLSGNTRNLLNVLNAIKGREKN